MVIGWHLLRSADDRIGSLGAPCTRTGAGATAQLADRAVLTSSLIFGATGLKINVGS